MDRTEPKIAPNILISLGAVCSVQKVKHTDQQVSAKSRGLAETDKKPQSPESDSTRLWLLKRMNVKICTIIVCDCQRREARECSG